MRCGEETDVFTLLNRTLATIYPGGHRHVESRATSMALLHIQSMISWAHGPTFCHVLALYSALFERHGFYSELLFYKIHIKLHMGIESYQG